MTFVDDVLEGKTKVEEVDDYIHMWYQLEDAEPMVAWLGFTEKDWDEYAAADPTTSDELLLNIINSKSQNRVASALKKVKEIASKFK